MTHYLTCLFFQVSCFLVRAIENKTSWAFFISGLMLGFAVITKGPAAILLVGLTGLCYQWVYRINFYTFKEILILVFGLVVIPGIFFSIQVSQNGWWFLKEFIIYQIELFKYPIASHGQPFYYHVVVLLFGCFPLFVFSLKSSFYSNSNKNGLYLCPIHESFILGCFNCIFFSHY